MSHPNIEFSRRVIPGLIRSSLSLSFTISLPLVAYVFQQWKNSSTFGGILLTPGGNGLSPNLLPLKPFLINSLIGGSFKANGASTNVKLAIDSY